MSTDPKDMEIMQLKNDLHIARKRMAKLEAWISRERDRAMQDELASEDEHSRRFFNLRAVGIMDLLSKA